MLKLACFAGACTAYLSWKVYDDISPMFCLPREWGKGTVFGFLRQFPFSVFENTFPILGELSC